MNDELTATDIAKMQEELHDRVFRLKPEIIEEVKRTRAFGDLSENYEYKAAKQAKIRNDSRIRYLERMIKSAKLIEDHAAADEVGLYDKVVLWIEDDEEEETVQIVTTVRCDPLKGLISKGSPLGSALLGRRVGERITIQVNDNVSYTAIVKSIEKQTDDGSAPLMAY